MVKKAGKVVAVLDIHNAELKEEWQKNRKALIQDYEEKYEGLDDAKLFIRKDFFEEFAKKNNLKISFYDTEIDGYWNGQFTYNVFMHKG